MLVRPQAVRAPDTLHRADAGSDLLRHAGAVQCMVSPGGSPCHNLSTYLRYSELVAIISRLLYMLLIKQRTGSVIVTFLAEDIFRSLNGDRWRLMRDSASGRSFVRHEPNRRSGGKVTDMDTEEFISRGGSGPEHVALRRLLQRTEARGSAPA